MGFGSESNRRVSNYVKSAVPRVLNPVGFEGGFNDLYGPFARIEEMRQERNRLYAEVNRLRRQVTRLEKKNQKLRKKLARLENERDLLTKVKGLISSVVDQIRH